MQHTTSELIRIAHAALSAFESGAPEAACQAANRRVEDYAEPIIWQHDNATTDVEAEEARAVLNAYYNRTGQ